MCVCVCVCVCVYWHIYVDPNLPIHPTPCPQACCVFNLLSASNSSNKVRIFWEHTLFQPLYPPFLCTFSSKHDVSESYMRSSLFCLGCGGQRRVVLTKVLVPLGASLLGNEGKKERWWVICCLVNTSIFSLFLSPTSSSYKHIFSAECAQGILNLIVTCLQGESSLMESKQWVWSSIVGICETSEMGSCIRWGASWRWSSLSWV